MNGHQGADISRVRRAWGRRGVRDAAECGDILVVVDTLRFSTAAATAAHHGARIYPCATDEALYNALAQRVRGEVALHQVKGRRYQGHGGTLARSVPSRHLRSHESIPPSTAEPHTG